MSMAGDIQELCRKTHEEGKLTQEEATDLLINIYGALEWEVDESISYREPNWPTLEQLAARKILWGDA